MSHSVLPIGAMRQTSAVIGLDHFQRIELWRGATGAEVRNYVFSGRVAPAAGGIAGRDEQTLPGDVSPQYYVMEINPEWDVIPGDEAWTGAARYRVVAVDPVPHHQQVLMQLLQ